jgi:hypothetical protein
VAGNVTDWVWEHSRAVNAPLIVLLAVAHEADRDGIAIMSVRELARKARVSSRSVQLAVRDLAALRELEVRSAGGGRGHRATYRVPIKGEDPAPFETVKGEDPAPFTGNPEDPAPFEPTGNPEDPAPFRRPKPQVSGTNPEDSSPFAISDVLITTTGTSEVQVKDVSEEARPDVTRLCARLASHIAANGSKRPAITKRWRDAARLMLDRDGRTEQQIASAIDWCQADEFWRANILSMPKLREKYDQLRLQAMRASGTKHTRQAEIDELFGAAMERAQAKENGNDTSRNGHPRPVHRSLLPPAEDRQPHP